ncbi:MAG: hypothetical protein R3E44_10085 [Paracoccaceae bacterium]
MFWRKKFKTPEAWSDEIFRLIAKYFAVVNDEDDDIRSLLAIATLTVDPVRRFALIEENDVNASVPHLTIRCDVTEDHQAVISFGGEEVRRYDMADQPETVAQMYGACVAEEFISAVQQHQLENAEDATGD